MGSSLTAILRLGLRPSCLCKSRIPRVATVVALARMSSPTLTPLIRTAPSRLRKPSVRIRRTTSSEYDAKSTSGFFQLREKGSLLSFFRSSPENPWVQVCSGRSMQETKAAEWRGRWGNSFERGLIGNDPKARATKNARTPSLEAGILNSQSRKRPYLRSIRSRFITLVQALTKSARNFSSPSLQAYTSEIPLTCESDPRTRSTELAFHLSSPDPLSLP